MSADDCVVPVLGYSTSNTLDLDDIGPNTLEWYEEYDNQIEWNIINGNEASPEVAELWERLSNMIPEPHQVPSADSTFNTANLLTTTWKQGSPYNTHCPYDSEKSKHALTGCVATAMGQIMKYWGYPECGRGTKSYSESRYGTHSANFADSVFDYASMPNKLTSSSPSTQIEAVSRLMYCCGIAVEMGYGVSGSSAHTISDGTYLYPSAENAYREYFKFKHTVHRVDLEDYGDAGWIDLMKNEINNGRPVQYSGKDDTDGGGHSFICCGYDNTNRLYFNWGWGGTSDGYYQIGHLNPGSDRYNTRNKAVIGIEPDTTGATTTVVTVTPASDDEGTATGSGTYVSYLNTVTIEAKPNPGYLFKSWENGCNYIKYEFLANGDSVNHTAYFEKIGGDTIGYCYGGNLDSEGSYDYGRKIWGIHLESNNIEPYRKLTRVNTYIVKSGTYHVHIFQGDEINSSNLVHSDTVDIPDSDVYSWISIKLSKSVRVNSSKDLWIVFVTTCSGNPMSVSAYRGSKEGAYGSEKLYSGWFNYVVKRSQRIAFQIRGVFEYDPTAVGVEEIATQGKMDIYSDGESIIIEDAENKEIRVFDAAGKMIAAKSGDADREVINVPQGIYVVTVDGNAQKIVVR